MPSTEQAHAEHVELATALLEVLRELHAVKGQLAELQAAQRVTALPAIPLDAFLNLLRDGYGCTVAKRTAQDMVADGRIPLMPKRQPQDKPWVNLVRWQEMASHPEQYHQQATRNAQGRRRPAPTDPLRGQQHAL